jgi:hypothetical protein
LTETSRTSDTPWSKRDAVELVETSASYILLLLHDLPPSKLHDVQLLLDVLWAECAPTFLLKGMLGMFCVITQSEDFLIAGRWLWCYLMLLSRR